MVALEGLEFMCYCSHLTFGAPNRAPYVNEDLRYVLGHKIVIPVYPFPIDRPQTPKSMKQVLAMCVAWL